MKKPVTVWPRSLRFRLIFSCVLVELLLLSVLIANSVRLIDAAARAGVEAVAASAVPMLNAAAVPYLLERDYASLQDLLAHTIGTSGSELVYVSIATADGQRVAQAGWPFDRPLPPVDAAEVRVTAVTLVNLERPVALAGQRLGTMRIGISTEIAGTTRTALLRQGMAIAAVEVALSVLALGAMGVWLARRLELAAAASRAIAAGDFTVRLPEAGHDEVADLARAVNRMSAEIAHRVDALRVLNESLEHRVIERTAALESTTREQQTLLDTATVGILFVRNRVIQRCNRGFEEILGYPPGGLLGQSTRIYFASETSYLALGARVYPEIQAGRPASGEWQFRRKDGRLIWGAYQGKAMDPHDLAAGSLWEVRDITASKEAAQQLAQRNAALERLVAELQLTQARLVEAEKLAALGQLTSGVAHEINTPLGVALSAASLLDEELRKVNRLVADNQLRRSDLQRFLDQAREAAQLLLGNCARAADLVRRFKSIAADPRGLERRRIALRPYLQEVMAPAKLALARAGSELVLEEGEDVEIESFPDLLADVLAQVLANLHDHAFADGAVGRAQIKLEAAGSDQVRIIVADTGNGIPQEALEHVFEPFFTSRRHAGHVGLGLHISYNLLTATLGGTIAVESEPGGGTRMILTLPRRVGMDLAGA